MVGTYGTAHDADVDEIQELLHSSVERAVEADHGAVLVRFAPLADLVAELVTRARVERAALWELLKRSVRNGIELAGHNTELAAENRRREADILDVIGERDGLEARLAAFGLLREISGGGR